MARPAVSLSQAGHCRAKLWFDAHGYEGEKPSIAVQRKFEVGHMLEAMLFDEVPLPNQSGEEKIGSWWSKLGEVKDYATGRTYKTKDIEIIGRQEEVEFAGFRGHLDGTGGPDPARVVDAKSVPARTFARNTRDDLLSNPFSRQAVVQVNTYAAAKREARPDLGLKDWMLIYINRDTLEIAVRAGEFSEALAEEARERLSWARSDEPPAPDWAWIPGFNIPLLCSYCSQRDNCAKLRGAEIRMKIDRGTPYWEVAA